MRPLKKSSRQSSLRNFWESVVNIPFGEKGACVRIRRSEIKCSSRVVKTGLEKVQEFQRFCLDEVVRRHPSLKLQERAELFVSLFEHALPRQSRVLDIGGGWGFYAKPLAERGHYVTVLDVVRPRLQKAPVVLYEGQRIPFEDKSFDVALFITTLHHIKTTEDIIREALRVTRKKIIVVEDLYHHALGRWWTVLRDRFYNFEYFGHPCRFKKREEWIASFEQLGCFLAEDKCLYTWLAGLRILNGVFVFNVGGVS